MTSTHTGITSLCIYCGSSDNVHPEYLAAARQMGQALAKHSIRLVYGAGKTGLMGAVANGVLEAGGQVCGVVCDSLNLPHLIHANLTTLEVVETIQQRKARMMDLADAFIALPGGFGTFDELFENLACIQIGLHSKPVGLLNTREYFNPLLAMVEHAFTEGFIYAEHRLLLTHASTPEELLASLADHHVPDGLERWLTRKEE
jgi:uncharacterized protein (TIGR00730 family)